jgi:hypothetical protein
LQAVDEIGVLSEDAKNDAGSSGEAVQVQSSLSGCLGFIGAWTTIVQIVHMK